MRAGILDLAVSLAAACALSAGCESAAPAEPGATAQEIIGGSRTTAYAAVPLLYSEFPDDTASFCTGTLISPRVVLTAAHCIDVDLAPTLQLVYFGADSTADPDPARIDSIDVAASDFDGEWNLADPEQGHDIGLILLERAPDVRPLTYNRESLAGREGDAVMLVGWGRTSGDGDDYGVKHAATSLLRSVNQRLVSYGSASVNTCQGDSGGPNFMMQDGEEVVVGITSFGNIGCDEYGYGTNVASYASSYVDSWILANDPGACAGNGQCVAACGQDDPDCPDGTGSFTPESIEGGCRAGGGAGREGAGGTALVLVAFAGALARRRRGRRGLPHAGRGVYIGDRGRGVGRAARRR